MKNPWVIVGLLTVILFGGALWYSSASGAKSNEGVVTKEHIKGNDAATVTLVEYSDFQCPACATFQSVVAEVLAQYGDRLRFEYRHFPLPIHPYAQQAAVAAEAAGQQGKFFEFHDKLFEQQQTWAATAAPAASFIQYATELGLDVELFKRHQRASLLRDAVRADLEEARDLGLTGTPTFFLNGERMTISSYEDFVTQIATAIDPQATAALRASSTPETGNLNDSVKFGF